MEDVLAFVVAHRFEIVSAACLLASAAAVIARWTPNKTDDAVVEAVKKALESVAGKQK